MKKFFITIFFTFLVILTGSVIFLTVNGFETKKFNNYVSKKMFIHGQIVQLMSDKHEN
jgi:hypothetical protein